MHVDSIGDDSRAVLHLEVLVKEDSARNGVPVLQCVGPNAILGADIGFKGLVKNISFTVFFALNNGIIETADLNVVKWQFRFKNRDLICVPSNAFLLDDSVRDFEIVLLFCKQLDSGLLLLPLFFNFHVCICLIVKVMFFSEV